MQNVTDMQTLKEPPHPLHQRFSEPPACDRVNNEAEMHSGIQNTRQNLHDARTFRYQVFMDFSPSNKPLLFHGI